MARLPVVATIRDAYSFTLHNVGAVIGLIWVPMLVLTVAGFFAMQHYYNAMIDALASGNPANMGPTILMVMGYLVMALLLYAVVLVSVVQLALGQRAPGAKAHFAFGALEWRTFRALAGLAGLAIFILLTVVLAGNAALTMLGGGTVNQTQGGTVLVLAIYLLLVAGTPRFLLLLPAVAVSENEQPALRRTWALSAGNFWRLLGVLAAVFIPVLLIFSVTEMLLAGAAPMPNATSDKMLMISMLVRAREVLPLVSGLSFLFTPFLVALFCGASVSAYRTIKGDDSKIQIIA